MKYDDLPLGEEIIVNKSEKTTVLKKESTWFEKGGRIYFEVKTLGLTEEEWKTRLTKAGYRISDWVNDILSTPDFNQHHRYQPEHTLKVCLIRGKEIRESAERSTKNLRAIATKDFGELSVSELKGELALLIREKFSNQDLDKMGLYYVAILHKPIISPSVNLPRVLGVGGIRSEFSLDACLVSPDSSWGGDGAFAFLQISF